FATAAQAPASLEFAGHLKAMPTNFVIDDSMPALERTGKAFEGIALTRWMWGGLLKAIRRHRPDHVYLPYADLLSLAAMAHVPGPVSPVGLHEKSAARIELGLPVDGRWISSVGVLDSRKGVDDLVTAFATAKLAPTDRLLLAGRAEPSVLAAVSAARSRIGEG